MFIIFEGTDGTGKSSLAQAVAAEIMRRKSGSRTTVNKIHRSQLTRPPLDEYVHDVSEYVPGTNVHIVADRWHWGEEVYGPLYRDGSAASLAQFRWTELWLASRGANVWHVTQPLDRLHARLTARGEDYLKPEHVELVKTMFEDVAKEAVTHTRTIEPEGDTTQLVGVVVNRAEYTDASVQPLLKYPSYVGRALPHTLIVSSEHSDGPAFMPTNGSSAEFLLSSLPVEWWKGVGLVTTECDDLPGLVDDLAGPQVLALGRDASDILMDNNIEHGGVPDPQHIKKFHHTKELDYGFLVRNNSDTGEITFSWPNT